VFLIAALSAKIGKLGSCRLRNKGVKRQIRRGISLRRFRIRKGGMNTTQGSRIASSIFIGRWTLKILLSLRDRPYRHGQLRRQLGSVSQRMLKPRSLRNLESAGLIARQVTQSKAIAVEYSLTTLGRTIIAPRRGMCRWAKRYRKDVKADLPLPEAERKNNLEGESYEHRG